jgi:hypothetical protein
VCIEANQAGTSDPTCPDITLQGVPLDGCCKPNGNCGVLDTFLGLGCVDPSQFTGGTPVKCGGADGGGDAASDAPVVTDAGPG